MASRTGKMAKTTGTLPLIEEILQEFFTDIKRELNMKAISGVLFTKKLIGYDLMQDIDREATPNLSNQLFLDHLIRNGTLETLSMLCDVLEETSESHLLPHHRAWSNKLKQKLTKVSRHKLNRISSYSRASAGFLTQTIDNIYALTHHNMVYVDLTCTL